MLKDDECHIVEIARGTLMIRPVRETYSAIIRIMIGDALVTRGDNDDRVLIRGEWDLRAVGDPNHLRS